MVFAGFMRCNEDLMREHGLDASPTFILYSSKGDILQCKIRRFNSPTSRYDPGLYGGKFHTECPLTNFVSEYGEVTDVWFTDIQPPAPISHWPGKLP